MPDLEISKCVQVIFFWIYNYIALLIHVPTFTIHTCFLFWCQMLWYMDNENTWYDANQLYMGAVELVPRRNLPWALRLIPNRGGGDNNVWIDSPGTEKCDTRLLHYGIVSCGVLVHSMRWDDQDDLIVVKSVMTVRNSELMWLGWSRFWSEQLGATDRFQKSETHQTRPRSSMKSMPVRNAWVSVMSLIGWDLLIAAGWWGCSFQRNVITEETFCRRTWKKISEAKETNKIINPLTWKS